MSFIRQCHIKNFADNYRSVRIYYGAVQKIRNAGGCGGQSNFRYGALRKIRGVRGSLHIALRNADENLKIGIFVILTENVSNKTR